jgi:hypothetical protein
MKGASLYVGSGARLELERLRSLIRLRNNVMRRSDWFSVSSFLEGTKDRSDITKIFPTFAFKLAIFLPSIEGFMRLALNDPTIFTQSPEDQFRKLIVDLVTRVVELVP